MWLLTSSPLKASCDLSEAGTCTCTLCLLSGAGTMGEVHLFAVWVHLTHRVYSRLIFLTFACCPKSLLFQKAFLG